MLIQCLWRSAKRGCSVGLFVMVGMFSLLAASNANAVRAALALHSRFLAERRQRCSMWVGESSAALRFTGEDGHGKHRKIYGNFYTQAIVKLGVGL